MKIVHLALVALLFAACANAQFPPCSGPVCNGRAYQCGNGVLYCCPFGKLIPSGCSPQCTAFNACGALPALDAILGKDSVDGDNGLTTQPPSLRGTD